MIRKAKKPAASPATGKGPAKPARRRRRGGRGVLWTIAAMLALSGLLRFGGETGRAIASGLAEAEADPGAMAGSGCEPAEDIAQVLALLHAREAKVAERESALEDRMQALAVTEAQVKTHMAELTAAEQSLEATMARSSSAAEEDLARLTSVYENMKPKDAAAVFETMSPEFAAGFLGRMRSDAAAAVMAGLDPEKAYAISVLLAGRNARAATE